MPTLRLLPILLFAAISLLALKATGILAGGGYTLGPAVPGDTANATAKSPGQVADAAASPEPPAAKALPPLGGERRSWAQEVFGYPDVTGSVTPKPAAEPPGTRPKEATMPHERGPGTAPGETAVLERLGERRQELEARARELEIREGLLKTAEQRLEARMEELKELETQNETAGQRKNEAEAARVKGLVTMYENMKAKDAARIFDRLEMRVLLDLATQINPRRMADILAAMTPEAAERLTGELAGKAGGGAKPPSLNELPKIEGKPRS